MMVQFRALGMTRVLYQASSSPERTSRVEEEKRNLNRIESPFSIRPKLISVIQREQNVLVILLLAFRTLRGVHQIPMNLPPSKPVGRPKN